MHFGQNRSAEAEQFKYFYLSINLIQMQQTDKP